MKGASENGLHRAESLPVLPILLFGLLGLLLKLTRTDDAVMFDPPGLLLVLNLLFLGVCPLLAGSLACRGYLASGSLTLLLLGSGVVDLALGSLLAGLLFPVGGPNAVVTLHNCAALLAGLLHAGGAAVGLLGVPADLDVRRRKTCLELALVGIPVVLGALTVGLWQGILPVFFIQDSGPTPLRQAILGAATGAFLFAGVGFLTLYSIARSRFLYWYALALLLIALGLGCVFVQHSFGSPIGWTGRLAQYLAGLYLVIAVVRSARERQVAVLRLDQILATLFRNRFEVLLEERTAELSVANADLRREMDSRA